MKIIISPSKTMATNIKKTDINISTPTFIEKSKILYSYLKSLNLNQLQNLYNCSENIAKTNYERYHSKFNTQKLIPCIFAYTGIQFQTINPIELDSEQLNFLNENLFIISALYGCLRPFDGIVPYRLEMSQKLGNPINKNLYEYWGKSILKLVTQEDKKILNLASEEYSKTIKSQIDYNVSVFTCDFRIYSDGKLKTNVVEAKKAKGAMVKYLAKLKEITIACVISFNKLGFEYSEELSSTHKLVFIKIE